jgi:uncharacterized protein
MIENTFQAFKGISNAKEKKLWADGIESWKNFVKQDKIKGLSHERKKTIDYKIMECMKKLHERDDRYFVSILPLKLHYRYYPMIRDELLFLDIESYGYNRMHEITIIGLGNTEYVKLIRADRTDSSEIRRIISECKGIVTYNGRSYDLPILKKRYGIDFSGKFIIDLRHMMRELGYVGGLKKIEEEMGIKRKLSHKIMNGDPINLWKAYKATGESHFIELLAEYVEADVSSLPIMLDYAYNKISKKVFRA